jgi:hypothetical protein
MNSIDRLHHRPRQQPRRNRQPSMPTTRGVTLTPRPHARRLVISVSPLPSRRAQVTERAAAATASPPRRNQPSHPRGSERKTKTEATRVVRSSAFRRPDPTNASQYGHCPAPPTPCTPAARSNPPPRPLASLSRRRGSEEDGGGDEAQEPPLHRLRAQAVRPLPCPLHLLPPLAPARGRAPPRRYLPASFWSPHVALLDVFSLKGYRSGAARRLVAGIYFYFIFC